MKLIVLEGPDGGGKSTLAAELAKIGYEVKPFGVPPLEIQRSSAKMRDFFMEPLRKAIASGEPVVFDRLHLSDRIYSPLMRNYPSVINYAMEAEFNHLISKVGGQIVICLPSLEVCLANWTRKMRAGLEYVQKAEVFRDVYTEYFHLVKTCQPEFIWYDYTKITAPSFALALHAMERSPR